MKIEEWLEVYKTLCLSFAVVILIITALCF